MNAQQLQELLRVVGLNEFSKVQLIQQIDHDRVGHTCTTEFY